MWSVKVAIPKGIQPAFGGKRAFKQTLKTADKATAIFRSAPLIAQFKDAIEKARGNPTCCPPELRGQRFRTL
jgi:Domain of unknown function (DUF6538)